jgi:pyruvate dehydrogenase E1 component
MIETNVDVSPDVNPVESAEWLEALDQVVDEAGPERASFLIELLQDRARANGVSLPVRLRTPYVNTIPVWEEKPYPGDRQMERRIKSLVRYNAAAMVSRANKNDHGIGGHISTFASLATLAEVGFNHFFRGSIQDEPGDFVYFQGHASPGIYARAFLEGRLTEAHLENFRHELRDHPGLSSYPHPWLMPEFWQFPTVSMGLGPINSIYHARFIKYMENRGFNHDSDRKVWAFLGDGEMDEPESTGAILHAVRDHLDNLIWVVNCNLQRLDGPVRGNGRIVDELEGLFRGAGWNVIKVLWGDSWDPLLQADHTGLLLKRMQETVDGEFQAYKGRGGKYIRERFFGKYPELLKMVEGVSDEDLGELRRGGHDAQKVFNAYERAFHHEGQPTVVLAKTIKGYGLGNAGESRNMAHNQKELSEEQLAQIVRRFDLHDVPEETVKSFDFFRPDAKSPEMEYLMERRRAMGGPVPARNVKHFDFKTPALDVLKDSLTGSGGREVSTTMAYVGILRNLLKDKDAGKYLVPIVPDEMRTFGMESLIAQVGIYASQGQLYEPVDAGQMLYYKESKTGQIFQEGITEAGAMATFTAAGTAYANFGHPMVPLFTYYSMFGFQRVGDLIWAFADSRGKGFLVGGTAGRTTLAGEGLQHQDGHTHVMASTVPTCKSYDPAYSYEIAVILLDGMKRMYEDKEDIFYYVTVGNENYLHPAMPEGVTDGILKGIYKFQAAPGGKATVQLFGSGAILNEVVRAQAVLAEKYGIQADVYSVTSYVELRREALTLERWNRMHPGQEPKKPYVQQLMEGTEGPIIAASDYMKILSDGLNPWLDNRVVSLGTDGFGRSENRRTLRKFFEVDTDAVVGFTLSTLARQGKFDVKKAEEALAELGLTDAKKNPMIS